MKKAILSMMSILLLTGISFAENNNITCPDNSMKKGMQGKELYCVKKSKKDVKNGKFISWHKNGTKKLETEYKENKINGPMKTWYDNGKQSGEVNYINGTKQGNTIGWHINGIKRAEGAVNNGKPCGVLKRWDDKGNAVSCRKDYKIMYNCEITNSGAVCPSCE